MSGYRRTSDANEQLARRIADMERQIRELGAAKPFQVPVLAVDPPVTDPSNMWILPDGRLRMRHLNTAGTAYVIREWKESTSDIATANTNMKDLMQAHLNAFHSGTAGTPPAPSAGSSSSGTAPASAPAAAQTYTKTYTGTWSAPYRESGAKRTDYPTRLYYGRADSFNGRQKSLIGFSHATITSDLTGSTIKSVKLKLHNVHAYWNAGATIYFGIHNNSTEPSTWPGLVSSKIAHFKFGKPEVKTVNLPLEVGTRFRAGTGKGIALEALNDSNEYYGWAGGVGSSYQDPQLIITYVK